MKEFQHLRDSGAFDAMPKKEALLHSRELAKLERNLFGIRNLERLPDAVFILDTKKEDIAVTEANKLGLPIIAVVDTNCDPDVIQYVIPGNDDAIRSGSLMCHVVSEAVKEGRFIASRRGIVPGGGSAGAVAATARTPEQEEAVAAQQAEARRAAAAAAAEREARIAAEQAEVDGGPEGELQVSDSEQSAAADVPATTGPAPVTAEATPPEDVAAAVESGQE
jgi:small subunit ribosomal protein S2